MSKGCYYADEVSFDLKDKDRILGIILLKFNNSHIEGNNVMYKSVRYNYMFLLAGFLIGFCMLIAFGTIGLLGMLAAAIISVSTVFVGFSPKHEFSGVKIISTNKRLVVFLDRSNMKLQDYYEIVDLLSELKEVEKK